MYLVIFLVLSSKSVGKQIIMFAVKYLFLLTFEFDHISISGNVNEIKLKILF